MTNCWLPIPVFNGVSQESKRLVESYLTTWIDVLADGSAAEVS